LPCGWHMYQLYRVCLVLAKARVLIAVFNLVRSRIPAFIFHRLPATLVRCPTWVACSLQRVHQTTVLATPHIIISDRCARVVVRAVRDQDIVAPALAPSHLFYTLRFPHNIRLLLLPFNGRFSRWTWVSRFRLGSCSSTCFGRKPLAITEMVLFQAGWTFSSFQCQSTDPDQWPDLILSLSITRLLMEETFLPLCQLSNRKLTIILLYLHFLLLLSFWYRWMQKLMLYLHTNYEKVLVTIWR